MIVYYLRHRYVDRAGNNQIKLIGYFSDRKLAEDGIADLVAKPGFVKYPTGFEILEVKVNEVNKEMIMVELGYNPLIW
jgi:hypothetical protein